MKLVDTINYLELDEQGKVRVVCGVCKAKDLQK